MKKIDLEQGSLDWLLHRQKFRNASESPALMGTSSFMTREQLWKEKNGVGKPFSGNVATRYGHQWEPFALAKAEELLEMKLTPGVFTMGPYGASLDAYGEKDGESFKVEIKCPYQKTKSKLWKDTEEDNIPDQYYWQLVHQDLVVPTTYSYFFVFIPDVSYRLIRFYENQGDRDVLMKAWDDFYANPPVNERTDAWWKEKAEMHRFLKDELSNLEGEMKALEGEIKAESEPFSEGFGMRVSTVERKGTVQYKNIPELKGVDLDQYRGKPSSFQKISHTKDEG